MFKAIRGQISRWRKLSVPRPVRLQIWRYSGLFMFEFVVVLLGVLAAQMLQESAANARARGDARVTVERAATEVASFRATSEYWLSAGPCLERRMDQLMRAAATGTDDPNVHGPPAADAALRLHALERADCHRGAASLWRGAGLGLCGAPDDGR